MSVLLNTNIRGRVFLFFSLTRKIKLLWNYWSWCVITTMECDEGKKEQKENCVYCFASILSNVDMPAKTERLSKKNLGHETEAFY